jgi:nucleoside-diphosphate-sugar epimerase
MTLMVMPDAIKALIDLEKVDQSRLAQLVYNVTSFSVSAQDIFNIVLEAFPDAKIRFDVDDCRQRIVDTWPESVDDSAACEDWDWQPDYNCERSFHEYLIPAIQKRYL